MVIDRGADRLPRGLYKTTEYNHSVLDKTRCRVNEDKGPSKTFIQTETSRLLIMLRFWRRLVAPSPVTQNLRFPWCSQQKLSDMGSRPSTMSPLASSLARWLDLKDKSQGSGFTLVASSNFTSNYLVRWCCH